MSSDHLAERRVLFSLIDGFQTSQVIYALTVLGVADILGGERRSAAEVAERAGTAPDPTYRLLRAAAALGLLDEDGERAFALTPLGDGLRSDAPSSLAGWAALIGSPNFWQNWGQLVETVRNGRTGWQNRLGTDAWTYRAEHPEEGQAFDRAMTSITSGNVEAIVTGYDFSGSARIVDVAGGRGHLLAEILRRNPGPRGVLFDQAHVVAGSSPILQGAGVEDRCEVVAGNFFESVPGGGDVYLLKAILHDWYDPEAKKILATCRRSMAEGSVLLVIERILEPPNQGLETKIFDLNMMVNPGGRERTEAEFATLFEETGFAFQRVHPTNCPYFLIEAKPA